MQDLRDPEVVTLYKQQLQQIDGLIHPHYIAQL
jgi:hypothetical protein